MMDQFQTLHVADIMKMCMKILYAKNGLDKITDFQTKTYTMLVTDIE